MCRYYMLLLATFVLGSLTCKANSFGRRSIDTLFAEADFAGMVRVVAGEEGPNGIIYQAQILQAFTSDSTGPFISFGRYSGIEIGREYLVFLTKSSMTVRERLEPRKEPIVLFNDTVEFDSPLDYRESRFMTITAPYYMIMLGGAATMMIDNPWGVFKQDELKGYPESVKIPYGLITLPDSIESVPIDTGFDRLFDIRWVRKSDVVSYMHHVRNRVSRKVVVETDDTLIIGGDRSIPGYPNYRALTVFTMGFIPDRILDSATEHLRQRLGDRFFSQLRLIRAIVVDSAEFYRLNPGWTNKLPMFSLQYLYTDTVGGIAGFWGQLKLNSWGSVYEEIGFPRIRDDPAKARFISIYEARRIAVQEGFPSHGLRTELKYSEAIGSIVWHLSYPDEEIGEIEFHILIDAHNGKVIRKYETRGYEIEW